MVEFRIVSGDFGQAQTGQLAFRAIDGPSGDAFLMPGAIRVGFEQIQGLERVGAAPGRGWMHPLGTRHQSPDLVTNDIAFECALRNGRRFIGICDAGAYAAVQAVVRAIPKRPRGKLIGIALSLMAVALLIFLLIHAASTATRPHAAQGLRDAAPTFNEQAVQLVTFMLQDDLQAALEENRESFLGSTKALLWLRLDALTTAREYDSRLRSQRDCR